MKAKLGLGVRVAGLVAAAAVLTGASASVFATAEPGLWEVARSGSQPVRLCLANTAALALFEHRKARCERTVIRDDGSAATIHYSCAGGDFGRSDVKVITPRALRIETQGISGGAPFKYTLQAHRIGNCPSH
jgi:hypothetical protein